MRGWVTASFTLLIAGVAAGACATGGQIGTGGSGTTGTGGSTAIGGAGGNATTTSASTTSSTSSSSTTSSGGTGGAPNPCEGITCNTPPPNQCNGSNLLVYAPVGTCGNGQCTYSQTPQPCANGCTNGMCNGDPCLGVTCNQAAASFCVDASHLRVRDLPGTCDAANNGACVYTTHDEFCAFGCTNGMCNGDPCLGVTCPPKANYCLDASTLVQYDAGQCTNGPPCTYGSTNVACANGCVNGQCVACTTSAQCSAGNWCSTNQCLPCNTDLHCGASCAACGGATPKCNGTSCVQCVSDADCGAGMACNSSNTCVTAGCAPPAAACQSGGNVDGTCATAYVISRATAGAAAGFVVNNNYGLCNRNNDFTDNSCGGGSGSDAAYKLFMRKGETANIQLTRGNATCASTWGGNISLKIFQAACDASCSCSTTSCATSVYCTQSNNQNPMFIAPADGWYTLVVDSVGPVADKGGVYYLSVKLACAGGNCACM